MTAERNDDDLAEAPARLRLAVIAATAVLVLAAGLGVNAMRREPVEAFVRLDRSLTMPDARLVATDGTPYDLRSETAGRVTLMFFGYLECPDACPIQMAVLGQAFDGLAGPVRDQFRVVFVTTDPARDGAAEIRTFLDRFDRSFIGLTGSPDQLRDVQFASGVPAAVAGAAEADGSYLVGHATQVLVFDRTGVAVRAYPLGVRQSDWARDLIELARSEPA